jgi:ABC-type lipoprotein release transport system permease subunit
LAAPFLADVLLPSSESFSYSTLSLMLTVSAAGVTALLGALGSLYPAWDASRKSPVEAMRHE